MAIRRRSGRGGTARPVGLESGVTAGESPRKRQTPRTSSTPAHSALCNNSNPPCTPYARHFKTLDPLDRRSVDAMIADARAARS